MKDIFGILLMFAGAASGLLFQDPVVWRFTESNQCYVALGQRLHLPMPLEEKLELKIIDKTSTPRLIIRYRKIQSNPPKPNPPRWQFVNESKTMILTSAERNDSGTYTLDTFDANGNKKDNYTLQLNTEAEVSSVKLSYSCLSPGVMKVYCSADGDNLRFNWTSDLNTLPQLENGNSALILNKDHHGNVTCRVENHVSYNNNTTELHPCPELTLIILSSVCVLLIMISILAFYIYKKRQGQKNKEAPSQDDRELVYAQVTHLPTDRTETRPRMSQAQDDDVEYAMVVTRTSKRKQKKKEDEVQYGELVFNTPEKNKPKVQDDCVYSQVQNSR
ncbi:uncharacterized protein LOC128317061 isoform X3 [Pangasianodon hypophthalmus]|uniref:uncharacterized protein LOC128317061 isoform X3 n=1 Tax=Pangasianodon hypophthalmus TaxID=310915 RepID=UPI000EFFD851|nr:uncharacterized protein LOC128317061 isoform X3 [Pangasianodon hypophthalmus]